jgi:hypothetical protein
MMGRSVCMPGYRQHCAASLASACNTLHVTPVGVLQVRPVEVTRGPPLSVRA